MLEGKEISSPQKKDRDRIETCNSAELWQSCLVEDALPAFKEAALESF